VQAVRDFKMALINTKNKYLEVAVVTRRFPTLPYI
jgi:hypothetical protein